MLIAAVIVGVVATALQLAPERGIGNRRVTL